MKKKLYENKGNETKFSEKILHLKYSGQKVTSKIVKTKDIH